MTEEDAMTAIANVEMASLWDGEEGDDWTDNADYYDATGEWIVRRWDVEVEIHPTDRVLDVGCGTGRSSRDAARRAQAGTVLGVDLSARMLDEARRRSRLDGLTNIEFRQADAQVHEFEPGVNDLAISVFGAMFFNDPTAAFVNIVRSIRPGGRLASLSWQPFERNEWLAVMFDALADGRDIPPPPSGAPGPFGLADREFVERILHTAGLVDVQLVPIEEPMWFGRDGDDAWGYVSGMGIVKGLTETLDVDARNAALDRLRQDVEAHATDDGVLMGSAAWLAIARKP